jgi:hypothetical protein
MNYLHHPGDCWRGDAGRGSSRAWLPLALLAIATAACGPVPQSQQSTGTPGEWREFEGSWNAAGTRRVLSLGSSGKSALLDLRGTMLLGGAGRPGAGFRAETIAFADPKTGLVGRSVWTDERGEQVFSEFTGEGTAARNRIAGTIVGGTGRFAGATGTYEFSWQYVVEAEDGTIQGRATGLKGRVRLDPAAGGARK